MRREKIFLLAVNLEAKLTKSKIFLLSCVSFIIGIAIGNFFAVPFLFVYILFLLFVFFIIIFRKQKICSVIFLCLFFSLLGNFRFNFTQFFRAKNLISYHNGEKVLFQGMVAEAPDIRSDKIKYTVETKKIYLENFESIKGKVLVSGELYPEYEYGDFLEISCKIQAPEKIDDFDYEKYLERYNIYSLCYFPKIKLLEKNKGDFLYLEILKFRNKLKDITDLAMKKPESSIFAAINLGLTRETPQDVLQVFANAGVSHIIAISGTNITIICGILMSFCISLGISRKKAFYLCSVTIFTYVLLVGSPVSAVRAGIMGFLVLLAVRLGRLSNIMNTLFFTAALMLLLNPRILLSDVSFQLSFLAVLSMVIFGKFFENFLEKIKTPKSFSIFESLNMTLSAQVLTMPIIIYDFGIISLVSLPANILIGPLLPMIMILGMVSVFFGLINIWFAKILIIPCFIALNFIIKISEILTNLPFAYFVIDKKSVFALIVYFVLLICAYCFGKNKKTASN